MTEEQYRRFVERERFMGLNYVRKLGARTAASLGLDTYERWMRNPEFERDLSNFRARWLLGLPV